MTAWNGNGLPPAAAARIARAGTDSVRGSLLSVPSTLGVESVGFRAVGEVMGSTVMHLGWSGYGGCGYYQGGFGQPGYRQSGFAGPLSGGSPTGLSWKGQPGTVTSGNNQGRYSFSGYQPYVQALRWAYETALWRMSAEAAALGAHGIIGITIRRAHVGVENHEFIAMGTAVQAPMVAPINRIFRSDLDGADFSKVLTSGYIPVDLAFGFSVGVRHDDYVTQQQSSRFFSGNTEVTGYTDLVQAVRADARQDFAETGGADGSHFAVISHMSLDIREYEPNDGHRDHIAEATVFGSTLLGFPRSVPQVSPPLTIMNLTDRTGRSST